MSRPEDIIDATAGGRMIWCDGMKHNDKTLFIDKREGDPGFSDESNQYYSVEPDEVQDFRDLPYEDEEFDLAVFDPPHVVCQNGMAELQGQVLKKYGALHADTWKSDLRKGFEELFRVLRPGGTLVFKFAVSVTDDFRDVLELAPYPPLLGTRTSRTDQLETRWFVFRKPRTGDR